MTRDEILTMPAGKEIDGLILTHVFKVENLEWRDAKEETGSYCKTYSPAGFYGKWPKSHQNYSDGGFCDKISAAWEVVEHLQKMPYGWQFEIVNISSGNSYEAILWGGDDDPDYDARAETMSLAICRAALLAVMELTS